MDSNGISFQSSHIVSSLETPHACYPKFSVLIKNYSLSYLRSVTEENSKERDRDLQSYVKLAA
jgi:hypothetical protein